MKSVKEIFKKIINKKQLKPLGRWNIDYCHDKINNKIDLSNEDHCGPCGQYRIDKIDKNQTLERLETSKISETLETLEKNTTKDGM
jgi:hypothetical protein